MGKEHWIETELGNILYLKNGCSFKSTDYCDEGIPLIRISNIQDGHIIIDSTVKLPNRLFKSDFVINKGDLLIAMSGATTGKYGTFNYDSIVLQNQRVGNLKLYSNSLVLPIFRDYLIASLRNIIEKTAYGGAQPNISPNKISQLIISLPPFNEQKRIVEKLDILLPKVKSAKARLEKIPTMLKKFRQSVLTEACSGRLTENWRDEKGLQNWDNVTLKDIANVKGGITKDTGKQKSTDSELPYLRVANVQRGYLNLSEIKTIKIPTEKVDQYLLQYGDILLNEGGDPDKLGRGWIWENQIEKCVHQNHVFRARLFDSRNQPKYISWYANSIGADFFLLSGKQTTGLASINKTMISNLPIMLPTFEEQQEIVRRVEKLFALADSIESKYRKAMERVEKMEQSILSMAFRGELVDPDPNDEPADQLLNRILSEKAKHESETKNKSRKAKVKSS